MKRRLNDEQGASLVMVIVFMLVFSVVIATLLDYSTTAFRATDAIASVRDDQQAVDGAMEAAINSIRRSSVTGLRDVPCGPFGPPAGSGGPSVSVTCDPVGDPALNGGKFDLIPKHAVFLTGTDPCDGLSVYGGNEFEVGGGVASRSRIAIGERINSTCQPVSGGGGTKMTVYGDSFAVNNWCSAPPAYNPRGPKSDCNYPPAGPELSLPVYDPAAASIDGMVVNPLPTCGSGGIATFYPGLYTQLPSVHAARSGCPSATVWWFSPVPNGTAITPGNASGIYYFDFPVGADLWELKPSTFPSYVIGGTPKVVNGTPSWGSNTAAGSVPVRKACEDPGITSTPWPGVQFIFGGTSRLYIQGSGAGEVELCAGRDTKGNQRIALYGLSTEAGQTNTRVDVVGDDQRRLALAVSASPGSIWVPDANPAARDIDLGGQATSAFAGNAQKTATLSYTDFADVVRGARVDNVFVQVRLAETDPTGKLNAQLRFTFDAAGASCPSGTTLTPPGSPLATGKCVLTTPITIMGVTSTLAVLEVEITSFLRTAFRYDDVNSLTAELILDGQDLQPGTPKKLPTEPPCTNNPSHADCVATPETASSTVDGMRLRVVHTTPGFRPSNTGSNPFLLMGSNATALFRGTFYAPSAPLDVQVHNNGDHIFGRGVVAKSIRMGVSQSAKGDNQPFLLPGGIPLRREVVLTAVVNSQQRLKARVHFDDSGGITGRGVNVLDWTVIR